MSKTAHDVFRPRNQPAQALYDAFRAEAAKRKGRSVDEWLSAERQVMWSVARDAAQQMGLPVLTMAQIEAAEHCAMGHVDYGAKWAYGIAEALHKARQAVAA